MVMIGNKLDLSDDVKISPEDGLKQCKEWNIQHLNVSAKTGQGCDKVVALLLSQIQKATSYIQ